VSTERRSFARYPASIELRASLLTRVEVSGGAELSILGNTDNISRGGVCVISDRTIPCNSVLRCEMVVPGSSVGVPTLMQVRWAEKGQDERRYRVGLQFLL
jgi:hypothetical protein